MLVVMILNLHCFFFFCRELARLTTRLVQKTYSPIHPISQRGSQRTRPETPYNLRFPSHPSHLAEFFEDPCCWSCCSLARIGNHPSLTIIATIRDSESHIHHMVWYESEEQKPDDYVLRQWFVESECEDWSIASIFLMSGALRRFP